MQALLDFENGPFDEKEKAALAYAQQLTIDAHGIDDALFDRLRQHYDEGEIVEISAMAGLFNYFNRVNDASADGADEAGRRTMRSLIVFRALLLVSVAPLPSSMSVDAGRRFRSGTPLGAVCRCRWQRRLRRVVVRSPHEVVQLRALRRREMVEGHGHRARPLLDNRADYPSIAVSGRAVVAQWREGVGEEGARILLARSSDGGATWSKPVTPHPVMEREFGFVSMLPLADGTARIAWLDGRASVHEGEGDTQLRAATMTATGSLTDEVLVDGRVCDCCQTSMAMTSRGPLLAIAIARRKRFATSSSRRRKRARTARLSMPMAG